MNVVLAAYGLPKQAVLNFMAWNKVAFEANDVSVWVGYHEELSDSDFPNLHIIKYPRKEKIFSIGRTVNYVIRRVENCPEDGRIIKTDPDIIFSDAVLRHVADKVSRGNGMIAICSDINSAEFVDSVVWEKATKRKTGKGACFAMTKHDWYRLNGYDERIEGWGGDDDEMERRALKLMPVEISCEKPLFHVSHPERKNRGNFPASSQRNMRYIMASDWRSVDWGMAK